MILPLLVTFHKGKVGEQPPVCDTTEPTGSTDEYDIKRNKAAGRLSDLILPFEDVCHG
jgi:hypothetical protein